MQPPAPSAQRECELFLEALDQPTPSARCAFLDVACAGDPALRTSVEALLRCHKEDEFLEHPLFTVSPRRDEGTAPGSLPPGSEPRLEQPGDQIGRYRLVSPLGEGGVGTVFLAEQLEPVRRSVALKVLKPGMDSRAVIARFATERQALALMDHPCIARVFDAGATPAGRPFFVMELIRGPRITEYCEAQRLGIRERLRLFLLVCQAIQHAHLKGVIHRDIKPSNILITPADDPAAPGLPKVIDFGIAKATQFHGVEVTFTEAQAFLGTPAYMSPEQADRNGMDIDTRTDVYSLGVLLYELLTGTTPFDGRALLAAGLDGMRRTIRDKEPDAPSVRLRAGPAAGSIASPTGAASSSAPAPVHAVRGDLDCIVLKAIEKDRARRYETVSNLAADVQRYLDGEPILARPPRLAYRLGKLVRRHKLAFVSALAIAGALVLGLGLATWQYRAKSRAEQRQGELRREAERQALAARRKAYAADMNLAQQALAANNLGRALELLEAHRDPAPANPPGLAPATDLRGWEWRYLWEQCRSDALFALAPHASEVGALAISGDGRWIAAGDNSGQLTVSDAGTREQVLSRRIGGRRAVVAFSPTQPLLAWAASDAGFGPDAQPNIRLWDAEARRFVGECLTREGAVRLAFNADGTRLISAASSGRVTLWRMPDGQPLRQWTLPDLSRFATVQFSADLDAVAYGAEAGRIVVMDLAEGQRRWSAQAAEELVTALAFSPDGRWVASGAGHVESAIRLWNATNGQLVARLEGHRTWVGALLFTPDSRSLISASGDETIRIWDLNDAASAILNVRSLSAGADADTDATPTGAKPDAWVPRISPRTALRGHHHEVWSLALMPDHGRLVSGCKDGSIYVWDMARRPRDRARTMLPAAARAWTFAQQGRSLLTVDPAGQVARWNGPGFAARQTAFAVGDRLFGALFSPDGKWLAVPGPDGRTRIWETETGQLRHELGAPGTRMIPVAFIPPNGYLLTRGFGPAAAQVWDLKSGQPVESWIAAMNFSPRSPMAFSPDGAWSFLLDGEGTGRLHRTDTGAEQVLESDLRQPAQVAFAPDGSRFAAVGRLGTGKLWETASARPLTTLRGFVQAMNAVAFSPDGRRLAVGGDGLEAVKLWDLDSLQEILTLEGQGSGFDSVGFSPDGLAIAACNRQGTLHLWFIPAESDGDQ